MSLCVGSMCPATVQWRWRARSESQSPQATETRSVGLPLGKPARGGSPGVIPPRGPLWISVEPLIRHEWSNRESGSAHTRTVRSCKNTMNCTMVCGVEEDVKRSNTHKHEWQMCLHSERTKGVLSTRPRWVFPLLKLANALVSTQPEGIILADMLLQKLDVWAQRLLVHPRAKHSNVFFDRSLHFACATLRNAQSTRKHLGNASTNVDTVVNGFVQCIVARQRKMCKMEELDATVEWREAAAKGSIISHPQYIVKPTISGRFATVHRRRWCVTGEWTGTLLAQCGLLVHFEGKTQVREPSSGSVPSSCDGPTAQINASSRVEGVCRMSLPVSSRVLSSLRICPMIGIVRHQKKWYARNDRRL